MSKLVNATRGYDSVTNKGAVTHSTSLNYCVDMFFLAGASRNMPESQIITVFERAFAQDKQVAAKLLFWARDARGGAGERRFFQVVMKHIASAYTEVFDQLMIHVPEFGYWKDVFVIEKPTVNNLNWLSIQLEESANANLLAKWFPRKGPWFVAMHKYLKITPKEFRKKLVDMTKVVETQMCSRQWSSIEYGKVPSLAMNKYRKAFFKHDGVRMTKFIEDVHEGTEKINASVLFPHQLYQAINERQNASAVEAQWNALPDYMEGTTERILPVCDVSGSMSGLPMDVSVSLGIYISERNKGIFKDAFLTFHESPQMQYLQGSLAQRMRQLSHADWGGTTNLQASFDLILNSAMREKISQEEMPTKLLIISDMEFDEACGSYRYGSPTNLDVIRHKYQAAGYVMPEIIFWNVNGRLGNSPAQVHDQGTGLVSGFSPSILKSILKGKVYGPEQLMMDTVMTDRYARVKVD
jgi:hypothetical protein